MVIREDGSTQQCAFTFKLSAESKEKIADLVAYCQKNVELTDEEGNSLLFKDFDADVLRE